MTCLNGLGKSLKYFLFPSNISHRLGLRTVTQKPLNIVKNYGTASIKNYFFNDIRRMNRNFFANSFFPNQRSKNCGLTVISKEKKEE